MMLLHNEIVRLFTLVDVVYSKGILVDRSNDKVNYVQKLILLIRSLQSKISKRIPAVKNTGRKRQSPKRFLPGIEFDTT